MYDPALEFSDRLEETRSGADEVSDFVHNTSYAFPSADVLVPAPMAVAILGQLTLVATAADFKLTQPRDGFRYVRYPDSFRATIMQLVNTGALSLNQSFANFDEINKRCAAVKPAVNNIVQLLMGDERNTARENERAIERHLPNQIRSLSMTIKACLDKSKETDETFRQLLELTMEIQESCTATQGRNKMKIDKANLRKKILDEEKRAVAEMKQLSAEKAKEARDEFLKAQKQYAKASRSMPGSFKIVALGLTDSVVNTASELASVMTLGLVNVGRTCLSNINRTLNDVSGIPNPPPAPPPEDLLDPAYQKASTLRELAEGLVSLLTSGSGGGPDWTTIKGSDGLDGCTGIRVSFEQALRDLGRAGKHVGAATQEAIDFAKQGIEFACSLGDMVPTGQSDQLSDLTNTLSAWRDQVVGFAAHADLKLKTPLINTNAFLPPPEIGRPGSSSAELAVRNAQYRLTVSQAQLNASRESSQAATEKLMEVTEKLGDILAQVAGINVQVVNWEEIMSILMRAINFLCQLKMYLNNLVHFFDAVNNLVSVTLQGATQQFIQIVKDAGAIEASGGGRQFGGVSLDAWARQAIYSHALSAAKISRLVENISGMYVTLYRGNVHPGVNMLLGMGSLVGSGDQRAVTKAGDDIQRWANAASKRITELVVERMQINESDIRRRVEELERSLGGILPPSPKLEKIVDRAEAEVVQEAAKEAETAAAENPTRARANDVVLGALGEEQSVDVDTPSHLIASHRIALRDHLRKRTVYR
ncbi:hypothetical protein C8Q78DRAFT_1082786 [Trametes maxima]|nr:hypothetical protein C8Q78DRAFT_1082786 [Trametes maxima]